MPAPPSLAAFCTQMALTRARKVTYQQVSSSPSPAKEHLWDAKSARHARVEQAVLISRKTPHLRYHKLTGSASLRSD